MAFTSYEEGCGFESGEAAPICPVKVALRGSATCSTHTPAKGWGNVQLIGSTVSDALISILLW